MDTEPLNVTVPNLMQSVLSSSRMVKSGSGVYRQKYSWLVLMDKIRKKLYLKKKKCGGSWLVRYPRNVCRTGKLSTRCQGR